MNLKEKIKDAIDKYKKDRPFWRKFFGFFGFFGFFRDWFGYQADIRKLKQLVDQAKDPKNPEKEVELYDLAMILYSYEKAHPIAMQPSANRNLEEGTMWTVSCAFSELPVEIPEGSNSASALGNFEIIFIKRGTVGLDYLSKMLTEDREEFTTEVRNKVFLNALNNINDVTHGDLHQKYCGLAQEESVAKDKRVKGVHDMAGLTEMGEKQWPGYLEYKKECKEIDELHADSKGVSSLRYVYQNQRNHYVTKEDMQALLNRSTMQSFRPNAERLGKLFRENHVGYMTDNASTFDRVMRRAACLYPYAATYIFRFAKGKSKKNTLNEDDRCKVLKAVCDDAGKHCYDLNDAGIHDIFAPEITKAEEAARKDKKEEQGRQEDHHPPSPSR